MDERKLFSPPKKVKIFIEDIGRVITREVILNEEDTSFFYVTNETQRKEAIAKRLVLRYVEAF